MSLARSPSSEDTNKPEAMVPTTHDGSVALSRGGTSPRYLIGDDTPPRHVRAFVDSQRPRCGGEGVDADAVDAAGLLERQPLGRGLVPGGKGGAGRRSIDCVRG